jgi:predicted Fe-Mo cluster-binding NifX family protein
MNRGKLGREIRVAVPTKEEGGVDDVVADVFGRAKTFTIVDIEGKAVTKVEVIQNPAASYKHGAGPIAVKMLIDRGVNTVVAGEFGPGVSTLLEQFNVGKTEVKRGTRVAEAIKPFIE